MFNESISIKINKYIKELDKIEYTKTLIGKINDMIYISKYRFGSYKFLGIL